MKIKRMLLAYCVQFDDGTVDFKQVLECQSFDLAYEPEIRRYGDAAYYGPKPLYTVHATGHTMYDWPAGWQRADDIEPQQISPAPLLLEGDAT